jgi:hypothetical protein
MRRILLVIALWALCYTAASPHGVRGQTQHDGHSLPLNRDDRNRQIVEWFMSVK